ncbi:MAG: prepilin peptidase [Chloroflexota bacterium]
METETPVTLIALVIAGLAIGALCNIAIERTPPVDDSPSYGLWRGVPLRVLARRATAAFAVAGIFALSATLFPDDPLRMALAASFGTVFAVLAFIDLETFFLPDKIVLPSLVVALAVSPLWSHMQVWEGLVGAVAGFAIFFPLAWYGDRTGKDIMGWGDVKFTALMGAVLGLQFLLVGLYLAVIVGGVIAVGALAARALGARVTLLPFGPSLVAGALAAMFYGRNLIDWAMASLV